MHITKEADYAIRVIYCLSKSESSEKVSASTISEDQSIPSQFLLKILRKLKKAELVKSFMGVNGGYVLNKPAEEISLKDVIEAIDGPILVNRCLYDRKSCNKYPTFCQIHMKLLPVQKNLINDLDSINFKNIHM